MYDLAQDLEGIAQCCPRLTSLNISSSRSLHPAALSILLPNLDQQQQAQCVHGGQGGSSSCALPWLTSLDVSYCPLPAGMVCRLLQYGYRFQVTPVSMGGAPSCPSWLALSNVLRSMLKLQSLETRCDPKPVASPVFPSTTAN